MRTEIARATRRWTVALASLGGIMMTLDINVVAIALPSISTEFNSSLASAQWTINAYSLAFAALLLPAGSASDLLGRRAIFGIGSAGFTAASLACGLAPSSQLLIIFRATQGAFGALVMATAVTLIAGVYQGRARDHAIGIFSSAGGAAVASGPTLGGVLVDTLGWRWIFFINLPLGALILIGTVFVLREPSSTAANPTRQIDGTGALLVCASLFALNYALLAGPDSGWTSHYVLLASLVGAMLLAGFLLLQRHRGERALIDLGLFRVPSFTASMALSFFARVTTLGLMPFLILWLQGMLGSNPTEAGLQLLPMTALIMIAAAASGTLQKHMPSNRVIALGFALIGTGAAALLPLQPGGSWLAALPALMLLGAGAGLSFPPLLGTAVSVVPPHRSGMASGMANSFFPLGTAGGVAAFGALLSARVHTELPATQLTELGVGPARTAVHQAIEAGQFNRLPELAPPGAHEGLISAAHSAFMSGMSTVALATAATAVVAVLVAWHGIRPQDRYDQQR